jgi:iron complex transport system ATP-binding protein
MVLVDLKGVEYLRGGQPILRGVDWRMKAGEHWAILGPNGAGKSTLAAILLGLEWPTRGRVEVLGELYGTTDLRRLRARIGFFQPALQSNHGVYHPDATALDIIVTGWDGSLARYVDYPPEAIERAERLYARHFRGTRESFPIDREFARLSSGERRKTLLLRTLMRSPELVLLDEPYESLDIPSRFALEQALVEEVMSGGAWTISILHRLEELPPFCTHALLLRDGAVMAAGPLKDMIRSESISALYDTPLKVGADSGRYYCIPAARP